MESILYGAPALRAGVGAALGIRTVLNLAEHEEVRLAVVAA